MRKLKLGKVKLLNFTATTYDPWEQRLANWSTRGNPNFLGKKKLIVYFVSPFMLNFCCYLYIVKKTFLYFINKYTYLGIHAQKILI